MTYNGTTFDGRQPLMVRQPFTEDDLRWKMTVDGSQPLIEDDF